MTVPDVIERRECPECGRRAKGPRHSPLGDPTGVCFGTPVTVHYGRLDALLRDDVVEAVKAIIVAEVDDHLSWNVRAYGKAWTGELEDTVFIVGDSARAALAAAVKHLTGGGE